MPAKSPNVRLIRYFFTESHITALQSHDPQQTKLGTVVSISREETELTGEEGAQHAVSITMETDNEQSENPPYAFKVVAVGFFMPASAENDELQQDYLNNLAVISVQVLIGAIREHLAAITARSPWGEFFAAVTEIRPKKQKEQLVEE